MNRIANRTLGALVAWLVALAGVVLLVALTGQPTAANAGPAVLYVRPPQVGCGGLINCYTSIQAAVNDAYRNTEVRVASGVYTGVQHIGGFTQVVYIPTSITLHGSYDLDFQATHPLSPTIIDAQGLGRGIVVYGELTRPITVTLQGLRVIHGNARAGGDKTIGGGILALDARLFLRDSTLASNTAYSDGGGVAPALNLLPGGCGGGFYAGNLLPGSTVDNCQFLDNAAAGATREAWGQGGGVMLANGSLLVRDSLFAGNIASRSGPGYGGGFAASYGQAKLEGNYFLSNTATLSITADGRGGALALLESGTFTLTNNFIAANHASDGGGGVLSDGAGGSAFVRALLLHNTIADNRGSGLLVGSDTAVTLTNNILAGNNWAIEVLLGGDSSVNADHTLLWNNRTQVTGTAAIVGNPAFLDPAVLDYHIGPGSAAIDRGRYVAVGSDIDGNPRPFGRPPDVGADEFLGIYLPLVVRSG